ncbi:ATP-binding protein [Aquimarina sp. MMG016]|uniref:tetratricopeptide repeat-containing sensor histidine kinase n=1 Tax=Aquimarina sp. MMG016 TaxID=2822690 RepID=UPI001B39FDAC|nr:ATP-binding protein [Aquimarina sp. MMG016]MBQ4821103.1 tetratricopeptide repeat-containing sensor histidine kinase [Aquimarina sp. MMG016]
MKWNFLTVLVLMFSGFLVFSQDNFSDNYFLHNSTIKDTLTFNKAINHLQELVVENQYDRAEKLVNNLIESGDKLNYQRGLGDVYLQKGRILNRTNRIVEAEKNYEIAEKYYKDINELRGLAMLNNDRFIIEESKGNLEKSADHLLEAKMYYERLNDSLAVSGMYNNLAMIYAGLNKIESAEEYYQKSITLKKQLGATGTGVTMNNLALLYIENNKSKKAHDLLLESIEINRKENNLRNTAQSYSIMAKVALYNKNYEKAKKYYDTTLCVASQTNFEILSVNAKQQLGLIAIESKNYKKAEELLKITREKFSSLQATPLLLKNYQFSFKLDSARGNLLGALTWQKEYQKLSDQRKSEASAKKIERAEARYKAELEHLRLIDEQEKREQETEAKLLRYRVITYTALGVILVILTFLVLIIRTRNERKRLIKQLNESNQIKNKLFSIISHDLKNEIHGLDSSLNLLKENALSEEEFREIIPLLANRTHQTSILLNNLLNWSKSQLKELNAKPTSFDINEVISDKFTFFETKAIQKNIRLINELNPTNIYADKAMFGIVAQNLIANAIKFCNPGDSIALESNERDDGYEICFRDTGVGIDPNHLDKLFAEETFTTDGTQNETGTGLGLRICKELVELNKGKIQVESKPGEGSTFCVFLPKAA